MALLREEGFVTHGNDVLLDCIVGRSRTDACRKRISFSAFPQVYPKPVLVNRSFSTYIRVQKKALSIDSTGLTGGDHAFVEVAHSAVRIIAACPQYNCPLLSHGLVGGRLAHAAR